MPTRVVAVSGARLLIGSAATLGAIAAVTAAAFAAKSLWCSSVKAPSDNKTAMADAPKRFKIGFIFLVPPGGDANGIELAVDEAGIHPTRIHAHVVT